MPVSRQFSRVPRVPFNATLAEGEKQQPPSAKLRAYLDLEVLLQPVDDAFADAERLAREGKRVVFEEKKFSQVQALVLPVLRQYVASLPRNDATLGEWQQILSFPRVLTCAQMVYIFETQDPADAAHAVEMWLASLIVHGKGFTLTSAGPDALTLQDAFLASVQAGWLAVAERIAKSPSVNVGAQYNEPFLLAAERGHLAIVRWLAPQLTGDAVESKNDAVCRAAETGQLPVIQWLAQQSDVDLSDENNVATFLAAENGHLRVVQWMAAQPGVDVTDDNNQAFILAAGQGHLRVAQWLAAQPGVVPSAQNNAAAVRAAENGHVAVVQWLSTLQGVDITANDNQVFIAAAEGGNLALVQWLAAQPGVNVSAKENSAVLLALSEGHLPVVEWLMKQPGVTYSDRMGWNIAAIARQGHLRSLQWLAGREGVDITRKLTRAIPSAARKGNLQILQWMGAQTNGSELSEPYNKALSSAVYFGRFSTVQWMAAQPGVDIARAFPARDDTFGRMNQRSPPIVQWLAARNTFSVEYLLFATPNIIGEIVAGMTPASQNLFALPIVKALVAEYTAEAVPEEIVAGVQFLLRPQGAAVQFQQHNTALLSALAGLAASRATAPALRGPIAGAVRALLDELT